MRAWFIAICTSIAALILVIFLLVLTPLGLHLGLRIAKKVLPGELHYQHVTGILIGPINATEITYRNKDLSIVIHHASFNYDLGSLLDKTLNIAYFKAGTVDVQTFKNASSPSQPTSLSNLKLPFALKIARARIQHLHINLAQQKQAIELANLKLRHFILNSAKLNAQFSFALVAPYAFDTELQLSGQPSHYQYQLIAKNTLFNFKLNGEGNLSQISFHTRAAKILQGLLSADGVLKWQPSLNWRITLNAKHLNLNRLDKRLPKQLNLHLSSTGSKNHDTQFKFNTVIQTPGATIKADGEHTPNWNVHWQVAINDLSSLLPKAQGQLHGQGTITGNVKRPMINGELNAKALRAFHINIANLTSRWRIDTGFHQASRVSLKADDIATPFSNINTLNLAVDGTPHAHTIQAQLLIDQQNLGKIKINTRLKGDLTAKRWQGLLEKLDFISDKIGTWHLARPGTVKVNTQNVSTTPLCWRYRQGQFCIYGSWHAAQSWQVELRGKQINLTPFLGKYAKNIYLNYPAQLKASVTGYGKSIGEANLALKLHKGSIDYYHAGKTFHTRFNNGRFNATLNQAGVSASIFMQLNASKQINAMIQLPHYRADKIPSKQQAIRGQIDLSGIDINLFNAFIPQLVKPTGMIEARIRLGGSLGKPQFNGQLNLKNGNISIPRLRLTLRQVRVNIKASGDKIDYFAQAYSKSQLLKIQGQAHLVPGKIDANISINADNLLIANTSQYMIYISPQLDIELHNKGVKITGQILIPKAKIRMASFTSSVTMPKDVVYIGGNQQRPVSFWNTLFNVKIVLGKQVTIDTRGLKGRLVGELTIANSPQKPATATGKLTLVDGTFTVQGTTLIISPTSSIIYKGNLLDDPYLDAQASKVIKNAANPNSQIFALINVTVGVNIEGTLKRPRITLFSNPPGLSQADILSYLIFGQPSNSNTPGNVTILLSAIKNLNFSGGSSGGLADQVSQGLGLAEFGVQDQTSIDALGTPLGFNQSSFVIGRYISPRIYFRYIRGLMTDDDIFQVRYLISKHWAVQTESGTLGSGGDILYSTESDD